ncbi:hypothetical protein OCGS_0609 [Oceaniovalibus guishaninsula JLT2003]|uniref:Uncharacterized protein n=1 Tax=Oceaniovalibus guishaninsula JLT2003 TaxID=1231392 RepID=K2HS32_9RHOB|nr:hypothetical protein [Oceaniovalibus guishaninsula]EKE45519.1 hypothetical protein OCGS_0609 [Oceaniovalibus guishaninsula JLT2003]
MFSNIFGGLFRPRPPFGAAQQPPQPKPEPRPEPKPQPPAAKDPVAQAPASTAPAETRPVDPVAPAAPPAAATNTAPPAAPTSPVVTTATSADEGPLAPAPAVDREALASAIVLMQAAQDEDAAARLAAERTREAIRVDTLFDRIAGPAAPRIVPDGKTSPYDPLAHGPADSRPPAPPVMDRTA